MKWNSMAIAVMVALALLLMPLGIAGADDSNNTTGDQTKIVKFEKIARLLNSKVDLNNLRDEILRKENKNRVRRTIEQDPALARTRVNVSDYQRAPQPRR